MTKIKLCGLRRACDMDYANALKPDYIGFVFAKKSKRFVTPEEAKSLKACLDSKIKAAGVFVNASKEMILDLANAHIIDMIQLHGDETNEDIEWFKARTDATIIKAFKIQTSEDIEKVKQCRADYVLLDSGTGSGETFDWNLIKGIERPYFLAGGLTPDNLKEAINQLHPFAVDASSSLETDGYKDLNKMTEFVRAVRESEEK